MKSLDLLEELMNCTHENIGAVRTLQSLPIEQLSAKHHANSWSALECIEHLNRYGDFYIPEISQRLSASPFPKSTRFKSGLLGNYFAKSMLPKENLNTMKTFTSMNPLNSTLNKDVLITFMRQQEQMLELLSLAKNADLIRIKTSISISKWIKLRLADTLRVVIYHNVRHVIQAKKAVELGF